MVSWGIARLTNRRIVGLMAVDLRRIGDEPGVRSTGTWHEDEDEHVLSSTETKGEDATEHGLWAGGMGEVTKTCR
jgi:hypothetical protein